MEGYNGSVQTIFTITQNHNENLF